MQRERFEIGAAGLIGNVLCLPPSRLLGAGTASLVDILLRGSREESAVVLVDRVAGNRKRAGTVVGSSSCIRLRRRIVRRLVVSLEVPIFERKWLHAAKIASVFRRRCLVIQGERLRIVVGILQVV